MLVFRWHSPRIAFTSQAIETLQVKGKLRFDHIVGMLRSRGQSCPQFAPIWGRGDVPLLSLSTSSGPAKNRVSATGKPSTSQVPQSASSGNAESTSLTPSWERYRAQRSATLSVSRDVQAEAGGRELGGDAGVKIGVVSRVV